MKLIFSTLLVIVLPCAAVSGQAAPAPQPPTFHFKGTITDPLDAGIKEAKVTFRN